MFPNSVIEDPATANAILSAMIDVRNAHGWGSVEDMYGGVSEYVEPTEE
jgi:hypothetical protein